MAEDGLDDGIQILHAEGDAWMGGTIHAEDLVGKRLAERTDAPEVEYDFTEPVQPGEKAFGFRARDISVPKQTN